MKSQNILAYLGLFILLTAFNFADPNQAPKDCRFINASEARAKAGSLITKTKQIVGWYLCQGDRKDLNSIHVAILPASTSKDIKKFRVQYIQENVNTPSKAKYKTLNNFKGARVLQGQVKQSTNQNPMFVDFFVRKKNNKTYVIIYKDNHARYKKTSLQSRRVISEILEKL